MFSQIIPTLKKIYSKKSDIVISIVVAIFVIIIGILLPQLEFLSQIFRSDLFGFNEKFSILGHVMIDTMRGMKLGAKFFLMIVAALSAMNITFFVYYTRCRIKTHLGAGLGIVGIIVGFLGIGCAACGSVLLTTLIGFVASTQLLGTLPFHGEEFSWLSIIILLIANYYLIKKINDPLVCKL